MKDRQSLYPGRVKLTPVDGQDNIYDLERADEPTEPGTALNTSNLLPDYVAEALGLNSADNPTPAKAFKKIAEGLEPEISTISINEAEDNTQVFIEYADDTRRSIWLRFGEENKLREIEVDERVIPVRWGTSAGSGT